MDQSSAAMHVPSATHSKVSLFKSRHIAYNLGFITLVSSFHVFVIGFSSPHWISLHHRKYHRQLTYETHYDQEDTGQQIYVSLWNAPCLSSSIFCLAGIRIAQVAFSFHFLGYVVCLVKAVYENCKKVNPTTYHSRMLELCVFVTAIIGTVGLTVFVVWYSSSLSNSHFSWSLTITFLSLVAIYCSLVLLVIGNRRPRVTQETIVLQRQDGVIILPNADNPNSHCGPSNYVPPLSDSRLQDVPQTQPLLLAQPYPRPAADYFRDPPPPYLYPPVYPLAPAQPPALYQYLAPGYVQASAPMAYDDMRPADTGPGTGVYGQDTPASAPPAYDDIQPAHKGQNTSGL